MKSVKYYSVQEVASELKIHPVTIYRDIKKGAVKPERVGSNYLINSQQKKQLSKIHKKRKLIIE